MDGRVGATLLAVLVALVAIAGCGGGGDDTEALTKQQLIKQGDKICTATNSKYGEEVEKFSADHKLDLNSKITPAIEVEAYEDLNIVLIGDSVAELAELTPESDQEEAYDELIGNAEAALAKAEADPKAAIKKSPFEDVNAEMQKFGFQICNF